MPSPPSIGARFSRARRAGVLAAVALAGAATLSACGGGGSHQDASEPSGKYVVQIVTASFPGAQRLSQHSHLVITVRNADRKTIPDLAVTVCNITCRYPAPKGAGTSSAPFASNLSQDSLSNPSRPIWVLEKPPGVCGYSCRSGGAGADATTAANTWALNRPLRPGATATFDWGLTAVRPGRHVVGWEIAAGINGKAKAVLQGGGGQPHGQFVVTISSRPTQAYVDQSGQIVTTL